LRRRRSAEELFAKAIARHGLDPNRLDDLLRTDRASGWLLTALQSAAVELGAAESQEPPEEPPAAEPGKAPKGD
jgi:hypothetical protein